jgi:hypothetical protein
MTHDALTKIRTKSITFSNPHSRAAETDGSYRWLLWQCRPFPQALAQNSRTNEELQLAAATPNAALSVLECKYHPLLQAATLVTSWSIEITAELAATFRDQRGHRLISILLGVIPALIAAWALGLNAFLAVETVQSAS